eukprot:1963633-Pyramimonas_sp.AAC.1
MVRTRVGNIPYLSQWCLTCAGIICGMFCGALGRRRGGGMSTTPPCPAGTGMPPALGPPASLVATPLAI